MFDRLLNLIGKDNFKKISDLNILIVGVGGVGGFTLEALVRSGVRNITIIDGDIIAESNLNRQIISNSKNIGIKKVLEARKRAKLINENVNIITYDMYLSKDNINILDNNFDYIIDACDDVCAKIILMKYAEEHNIKIICALGTGKRINPIEVKITTLDKTLNDPLAKKVRNEAKRAGINLKIPVVYSEGNRINDDKIIGSPVFVPGIAGIYLAYYIINDTIKNN